MERFTADILEFLPKKVKVLLLSGQLGIHSQIQAFQGFSWNLLIL